MTFTEDKYRDQNEKILKSIVKDTSDDRMFGCVVGAFVGDSCGSFNEFNSSFESDEFMEKCMEMPGRGPFGLAPG